MKQELGDPPITFTVALALILFDAILWFGFSILYILDLHPAIPAEGLVRWIMAGLALLTSGALVVLGILLHRRMRLAFPAALALLLLISILTVTDEFGIADLAVLILHLSTLGLLLRARHWFFQA